MQSRTRKKLMFPYGNIGWIKVKYNSPQIESVHTCHTVDQRSRSDTHKYHTHRHLGHCRYGPVWQGFREEHKAKNIHKRSNRSCITVQHKQVMHYSRTQIEVNVNMLTAFFQKFKHLQQEDIYLAMTGS